MIPSRKSVEYGAGVDLPELRATLREEPVPATATVVVRGGPDSVARLTAHAARTARAYALDGVPALGISVFAALDDIGAASLDGILAGKLSSYRVVHLITAGELETAGFTLLPTFGRPHMTLLLKSVEQVGQLLDRLGAARPNHHYGETTGRRRR
jgi:hypothetical protein